MKNTLTYEEVKPFFRYCKLTHDLIWVNRQGSRSAGNKAGTKRIDGYKWVKLKGVYYGVHRIIWLLCNKEWPIEIDHINHDRSDNNINNLRNVTHQTNMKNRTLGKHNTSGHIGVMFHKGSKRWRARITVDGSKVEIGSFKTIDQAITARKKADKKYNYHQNHGLISRKKSFTL